MALLLALPLVACTSRIYEVDLTDADESPDAQEGDAKDGREASADAVHPGLPLDADSLVDSRADSLADSNARDGLFDGGPRPDARAPADGGGSVPACSNGVCTGLQLSGAIVTSAPVPVGTLRLLSGGFEQGQRSCHPGGLCVTGGIVP